MPSQQETTAMTDENSAIEVRHNPAANRFEAIVDGLLCSTDYYLDGDVMRMHHTGVPPALEGRGIASRLVRAAFAYADANGLRIEPRCSYVAAYVRRHPETQRLLAAG
jgi:hypothetical protein